MNIKTLRNFIMILNIMVVLMFVSPCHAETQYNMSILNLDVSNYEADETVKLLISVTDNDGYSPSGLTRENFSITDDNKKNSDYSLDAVSVEKDPVAVVLVIDVSGSMIGVPISAARKSAISFVRGLEKNDRVAIHTFDTEYHNIKNLSTDHEDIIKAIEKIEPERKDTALNDAVSEVVKAMENQPERRRIIVFLTDGRENSSKIKEEQLMERLKSMNPRKGRIPIFTVGLGNDIDQPQLQKIAKATGGKFYHAPKPEDLEDIYTRIAREIKNQFVLSYKPGRPADCGVHYFKLTSSFKGNDSVNYDFSEEMQYMVKMPNPPAEKKEDIKDFAMFILMGACGGGVLGIFPILGITAGNRKQRRKRTILGFLLFLTLILTGAFSGFVYYLLTAN